MIVITNQKTKRYSRLLGMQEMVKSMTLDNKIAADVAAQKTVSINSELIIIVRRKALKNYPKSLSAYFLKKMKLLLALKRSLIT